MVQVCIIINHITKSNLIGKQSLLLTACDARGIIGEQIVYEFNDQTDDQCKCKSHVTGRNCNDCKAGTWNLTQSNPQGCQCK